MGKETVIAFILQAKYTPVLSTKCHSVTPEYKLLSEEIKDTVRILFLGLARHYTVGTRSSRAVLGKSSSDDQLPPSS